MEVERRVRTGVVAVLVAAIVAIGGVGAWNVTRPEPTKKFCTLGLGFTTIQGRTVILQDQGDPGRDRCDLEGSSRRDGDVLGFDCAIRDSTGRTVDTTTPNRDDGTCGQAEVGA